MPSMNISKPSNCLSYESTYEELVFQDGFVQGGCLSWLNFLTNRLVILLQHNIPLSLTITAVTSTHLESVEDVQCNSEYAVQKIIYALQYPTNVTSSILCGNNYWKVRLCGSSQPAICVNCIDPCGSVFCNGFNPFFISPCHSDSNSCPAEPFYSRYFKVSFLVKDSIPIIANASSIQSVTSVAINVSISTDAYVTCGVLPDGLLTIGADIVNIIYEQHQIVPTKDKKASLILSNLQPLTTYTLYCIPEGFGGKLAYLGSATDTTCVMSNILKSQTLSSQVIGSSEDLNLQILQPFVKKENLASRRLSAGDTVSQLNSVILSTSISTACCNKLNVLINRAFVYRYTDQINIITLSLNHLPEMYAILVNINIYFPQSNDISWMETLLWSRANISTVKISLSKDEIPYDGNYSVSVTVNSSDYTVSFNSMVNILRVIPEINSIPSPNIISTTLLPSATVVLIKFDSPTNRARITTTTFSCSLLFIFPGSEKTLCCWIDDSTAKVLLRSDSTVQPGDKILFNGTDLQAQCIGDTSTLCDTWPTLGLRFINITLMEDTESYVPNVMIVAPEIIAIFSDVYLDVSNSLGSGSRPWKSIDFKVYSSNISSAMEIESYLNTNYSIFPPSAIPSALTYTGLYNVVVHMCNFLGFCSYGSHSFTVILSYYPQVTIAGPTSIKMFTSKDLTLTSLSRVYTLRGDEVFASSQNMSFLWTVSQSNTAIRQLFSPEYTRNDLFIPAYSLTPNLLYSVTVTVMSDIFSKVSSATMKIFVETGNIVAVISGGGQQWIKEGSLLNISAENSFIEDFSSGESLLALSFSWRCYQYIPFYSTECSLSLSVAPCGYYITLATTSSSTNTGSTITVTTTDGSRYAESSVNVFSYNDNRPVITVDTISVGTKVNPSSAFTLSAFVALEQSSMITCDLSVNDSSINMTAVASSPVRMILDVENIARSSLPIYFGIASNMLGYSNGLRFTVTCVNDQELMAMNFIDIAINQPPVSGVIVLKPRIGVELTDVFSIVSVGFYDDDLPLSFEFGFIDAENLTQCLQYRSSRVYAYSKLAKIGGGATSRVSVVVSAFDYFDASIVSASTAELISRSNTTDEDLALLEDFMANQPFIDTALSSLDLQEVTLGTTFLNNHLYIDSSIEPDYRLIFSDNLLQLTNGFSDAYIRNRWLMALLAITQPYVDLWSSSFYSILETLRYIVQQTTSSDFNVEFLQKVSIITDRLNFAMLLYPTLSVRENFNTIRQAWSALNAYGLRGFIIGQRGGNYAWEFFQSTTVASYLNATVPNIFAFNILMNGNLTLNLSTTFDAAIVRLSVSSFAFHGIYVNLSNNAYLQSISTPTTLQMDDPSLCISNNCTVSLFFYNYENQSYFSTRPQVVTTLCVQGLAQYFTHNCGNGVNYTVYCDGVYGGFINSTCPYELSIPLCFVEYSLNGASLNSTLCTVTQFTSSYTACQCSYSQLAAIPVTPSGYTFTAMKYTETHNNLFFSSVYAYQNVTTLFPVISLLMTTKIAIENPLSEALSAEDKSFISDMVTNLLLLSEGRSVVDVTSSQLIGSSPVVIEVEFTSNITTNSYCTINNAVTAYANALTTIQEVYNLEIPSFVATNSTVLQNSVAVDVAVMWLSGTTSETSALQQKFCRDQFSSSSWYDTPKSQNALALKPLSSRPTNFAPLEFAVTYSLALIFFFLISLFYFYLSKTSNVVEMIDKQIEAYFPVAKKPLPMPSATDTIETKSSLQPDWCKKDKHDFSDDSDASLDVQCSRSYSLCSDFENGNTQRPWLRDKDDSSTFSHFDMGMDYINSFSPGSQKAVHDDNCSTTTTTTRQRFVCNDDFADIYSVHNEVCDFSLLSPSSQTQEDITTSHRAGKSDCKAFNNLSFYNGECSVTGLLSETGGDFDDMTMMTNPLNVATTSKSSPSKSHYGGFYDLHYSNDTTILFGNRRPEDAEAAAEASTKRNAIVSEDDLPELDHSTDSTNSSKEKSPNGSEDQDDAISTRSRVSSALSRASSFYSLVSNMNFSMNINSMLSSQSSDYSGVHYSGGKSNNSTKQRTLSFYLKNLDSSIHSKLSHNKHSLPLAHHSTSSVDNIQWQRFVEESDTSIVLDAEQLEQQYEDDDNDDEEEGKETAKEKELSQLPENPFEEI